jgi:hypothetical protein
MKTLQASTSRWFVTTTLSVAFALAPLASQAQNRNQPNASEASVAASALPIALSVVAPAAVLSAGVVLTVVALESTARGAVWVLERASDGVRLSVEVAGSVVAGASLAVGGAIIVTAISTGYVLHHASRAVLFVPNELGGSLLYNQRLSY